MLRNSPLRSPVFSLRSSVFRPPGYTIVELLIVVTVAGTLLALSLPRAQAMLDRAAVRAAAGDVRATLASARAIALAGRSAVGVDIDSASGVLRVRRGAEMLASRNIGSLHGVKLRCTRDSLTYDARGLGRGAANLSVIVRRGAAVETVFVSRLGRVR